MKMIKASERLPEKTGTYFCYDNRYNRKVVSSFSTNKIRGSRGSLFYMRPYDIEYLDESEEQPGENEYWQKRCEAAETILDHLQVTKLNFEPNNQFLVEINNWKKLKTQTP